MDSDRLELAGTPVPVETAARWLADARSDGKPGYNRNTVAFYDFGGPRNSMPEPSAPGGVTLSDVGRLVVFAARLNYRTAQKLLAFDSNAWPTGSIPALADVAGDGDEFVVAEPVAALWGLWRELTAISGVDFAVASKLLHLKWPHFVPVADDAVRAVYRDRAVRHHNASDHIRRNRRRRTASANVRAYWLAVRDDVVANRDALARLRTLVGELADDRADPAHARRLQALSDVRLLDAVAWGLGTDRLKAG